MAGSPTRSDGPRIGTGACGDVAVPDVAGSPGHRATVTGTVPPEGWSP